MATPSAHSDVVIDYFAIIRVADGGASPGAAGVNGKRSDIAPVIVKSCTGNPHHQVSQITQQQTALCFKYWKARATAVTPEPAL